MSNFWNLSDGTQPEKTASFDSGSIDVIPDNTDLLAFIDEAGWKDGFEGSPDVISLRWTVLKPEAFKNRKIFQKLRVNDPDPAKSDKAKRMLMAIDVNAGGKLSKINHVPEDNDLMMALMNKPMILKSKVWKMDGKEGNWVAAVSAAKARQAQPAPAPEPVAAPKGDLEDLDDIPF